jgi:hypothetical protein
MGIVDLESKTQPQLSIISQQAIVLVEHTVVTVGVYSVSIQRRNWLLNIRYMFQISTEPRGMTRENYSNLQLSRSELDYETGMSTNNTVYLEE